MDTYIFSIRSISDVWNIFYIDEWGVCWLIVEKAPIFISSSFWWSIQDFIFHTQYVDVAFLVWEHLFAFINNSLCLKELLWWGLTTYDSRRWGFIPIFGGEYHHEAVWCVFNVYKYICSSPSRGLFQNVSCLIFLNASASS